MINSSECYITTGKVVISWKLLNLSGGIKREIGFFISTFQKKEGVT